jgi:hypothetical protein
VTRIVVTGGRSYGFVPPHTPLSDHLAAKVQAAMERARFEQIMAAAVPRLGLTDLACGRCRTGADELAFRWAKKNLPKDNFQGFPANWQQFGTDAGPERNGRMLRTFQPDKVLAFPGGDGTADCVRQAEALGIEVIRIDWA